MQKMASSKPPRNGVTIDKPGLYPLSERDGIIVSHNILSQNELQDYFAVASTVDRKSGWSGYGMKPRKEVCYTIDGNPFLYSGVKHYTVKYPEHVLKVIPRFLEVTQTYLPTNVRNPYTVLSHGVDII